MSVLLVWALTTRGLIAVPTPLHRLQQNKPYRPGGRVGFIDRPPISAAIIFTALLPDGATGRWQGVEQAHAPRVQQQMDHEEEASRRRAGGDGGRWGGHELTLSLVICALIWSLANTTRVKHGLAVPTGRSLDDLTPTLNSNHAEVPQPPSLSTQSACPQLDIVSGS